MTILNKLVAEEKFPIATAMYVADGTVYVFADDFHQNQLTLAETTTIDAMDFTDWVGHYWATPKLESYQGIVYCGEGSWGSDGVVYFADRDGEVQWLFVSPRHQPNHRRSDLTRPRYRSQLFTRICHPHPQAREHPPIGTRTIKLG